MRTAPRVSHPERRSSHARRRSTAPTSRVSGLRHPSTAPARGPFARASLSGEKRPLETRALETRTPRPFPSRRRRRWFRWFRRHRRHRHRRRRRRRRRVFDRIHPFRFANQIRFVGFDCSLHSAESSPLGHRARARAPARSSSPRVEAKRWNRTGSRRLRVANVAFASRTSSSRTSSSSVVGWMVGWMDGRSVGRLVGRTERRGKNIASLVTVFSSFGCKI